MVDKSHPINKLIELELNQLKPGSIILDVGTSKRFAKEVKFFESILAQHLYYSLGYKSTTCDIDGDIHRLPFKDNSADALICFEVIEHVENPAQAINEIRRVLKPGGTLVLTTPFLLPYHGRSTKLDSYSHENYPDYWRFTHQGLQFLCKDFSRAKVYAFSTTLGFYVNMLFSVTRIDRLKKLFSRLFFVEKPTLGQATYRHLVIAKKYL